MIFIVIVALFLLNLSIEATVADKLDLQISGCLEILVPPKRFDKVCNFEEGARVNANCKEGKKKGNWNLTKKDGSTEPLNDNSNGNLDITLNEGYDGAVLTCFITELFPGTFGSQNRTKDLDVLFQINAKKVSDSHENADLTRNASNRDTLGSLTGSANSTLVVSASCTALVIAVIVCYFIWQALKKCTSKRPHRETPRKDTTHPTSHRVRWTAEEKSKDCEEYAKVIDELYESERSMYSEPVTVPQYATPIPKCDRKKRKEDSYENVVDKHSKYANVNVPLASDYAAAYDKVHTGEYDLDGYCDIYL